MISLASDSLPSSYSQYFNILVLPLSSLFITLFSSSSCLFPYLRLSLHLSCSTPICLHVHLLFSSLSGPFTVSVEDPPPAPPISVPSFPSSSSSAFSPPSSERWTSERSRPRGAAPNRNARIPPRTDLPLDTQTPFVWRRGELTECSATCGKG